MHNLINNFYVYAYLDPRKPGIYQYDEYCFDHEPFYIGKGHNWRAYDFATRRGRCKTKIKSLCKIGLKQIVDIVQIVRNEKLAFDLEKLLIVLIGRLDIGTGILTNHTNGGEGPSGWKHSDQTKRLMSLQRKGRIVSDITREKMRKAQQNRPEEVLRKISQSKMGHYTSEETKKKMSISHLGKKLPPFSDEHKRKIGDSNRGKKRTKEVRLQQSLSRKGNMSEETRKKIIDFNTGRKPSDETKMKISESLKLAYKNGKR